MSNSQIPSLPATPIPVRLSIRRKDESSSPHSTTDIEHTICTADIASRLKLWGASEDQVDNTAEELASLLNDPTIGNLLYESTQAELSFDQEIFYGDLDDERITNLLQQRFERGLKNFIDTAKTLTSTAKTLTKEQQKQQKAAASLTRYRFDVLEPGSFGGEGEARSMVDIVADITDGLPFLRIYLPNGELPDGWNDDEVSRGIWKRCDVWVKPRVRQGGFGLDPWYDKLSLTVPRTASNIGAHSIAVHKGVEKSSSDPPNSEAPYSGAYLVAEHSITEAFPSLASMQKR